MLTLRVWLALALYIFFVALLAWARPAFLMTPDGQFKQAGLETSDQRSVLSAAVLFPLVAVLCYYLASVLFAFA